MTKKGTTTYPEEQREFLKAHAYGRTRQELTDMFNAEFGTSKSKAAIAAMCKINGWSSGSDGRFKKGRVSENKGRKMSPEQYERCKGTMFKKGNKPPNMHPVGAKIKRSDGYWQRKIAEPNIWRLEHLCVYEENFGPIPPDHIVRICDGDKDNLSPDNLLLCSKRNQIVKNSHGIRGYDKESEEVATAIADVLIAMTDIKLGRNGMERKQPETVRGKRVRVALAIKGMSMTELAKKAHYSYKSLNNAVNSHAFGGVTDAMLDAIAKVLNVSPEWLNGGGIDPDEMVGEYE